MKLLFKILLSLILVYLLFWGGVAAYFTYADRYKGLLESNLSSVFKRDVTIDSVETVWRGLSPRLKIEGFKVAGDMQSEPALAFESLSAVVSPSSVLTLWPSFTEFAIEKPLIEIVSLEDNQLQIAGIKLQNKPRKVSVNQKAISWLLDQQSASWTDGEIVWRRDENRIHNYKNIDIDFSRTSESRELKASVNTPKGPLAFTMKTNGDLIADSQWDASLEVEGEGGERLLTSKDFSVHVNDGHGRVLLTTLDVERIRDFIKLTGLTNEAGWLLDAKLSGRLHDMQLDFSGPLLNINTWSLQAAASDIGFQSIGRAPAMNNLSGELKASAKGGTFIFATRNSEFSWSKWYDESFRISRAMGEFKWNINSEGAVDVSLLNGVFEDKNARISNINAKINVDTKARKVSSFGQLFKVDSVADLSYTKSGEMVDDPVESEVLAPLMIDASAEFEIFDMSRLVGYLPNDPKLRKFRAWSADAFRSGKMTNGIATYKGEVSKTAFAQGKANLDVRVDFADVTVDYAPKQNWPPVKRGSGSASIENELLTISPSKIWFNGDPLKDAQVQITSLFHADRALKVSGKSTTSLIKGMNFLFKGPLIKPEKQVADLPLTPQSGFVDISAQIDMMLNDIVNTRVIGTAQIRDGSCLLPEGVPVKNVNALINFTERKVESDNVRATFLGRENRGKLITVKEAQPPIMKLMASGVADIDALEPWIGEHLLTWFNGEAPWKGSILFDANRVEIEGESNLVGVEVTAPAPLLKTPEQPSSLKLSMAYGGGDVGQMLSINYDDSMSVRFEANNPTDNALKPPSLFDNALIEIGTQTNSALKPGVNFSIQDDDIDLDDWLTAIIDLASYEPEIAADNTDFLDGMRSVSIVASNPVFLDREFGPIDISTVSVDGLNWIGTLSGENIAGTLNMQPRAKVSSYSFKLDHLIVGKELNSDLPPEKIDYSLRPEDLPKISLEVGSFRLSGKSLGALFFKGKPDGQKWSIDEFDLKHNGIHTAASGSWINNEEFGSISKFSFNTVIDEAEGAFNDMDFDGFIRKGDGTISGNLRWIGAPHEFDYSRLNGEFDAFIKDGELVKVEPGGGKLLGLFNFNAIARRLVFDFRDVFASGLKFDRMRYAGAFADGEAILSEAFVLAPAVFVRMEGKVDLDKELVDLEVHVSPELGGNLALLSALANPAAGAFVFITQRIFKDEMRNSSFKSYRALGTWEDFELEEFKGSASDVVESSDSVQEPDDLSSQADGELESPEPEDFERQGLEVDSVEIDSVEIEDESGSENSNREPVFELEHQRLSQEIESSQLDPSL